MKSSNAGKVQVERVVRRVVTKASDDGSFQVGDHIRIIKDGSIECREAGGWMNAEDVPGATSGMESVPDAEWVENRRKKLQSELDALRA